MKRKNKGKWTICILAMVLIILVALMLDKGNESDIKVIGYTYEQGNTVWEMAQKHCPKEMDIRDVVREIEELNNIENAIVYKDTFYLVPIYEVKA